MQTREIRKCFSLFIPINLKQAQQEIEALIKASMIVDNATKLMTQGKINPEQLLEMIEPHIIDMDQYIEEVEISLGEILGD